MLTKTILITALIGALASPAFAAPAFAQSGKRHVTTPVTAPAQARAQARHFNYPSYDEDGNINE